MNTSNSTLAPVLNFRCPTCSKLYQVDSRLIKSSSPQFDCVVCSEVFYFHYPPADWNKIEALRMEDRNSASKKLDKVCPKCSAINMNSAQECYSCQVVFQNYELLKKETFPNALPSLVQTWQNYLQDYENLEKQSHFLQKCFSLNQLDYAQAKISSLKKVMGSEDLICVQAMDELNRLIKIKQQEKRLQPQDGMKRFKNEPLLNLTKRFLRQRRVLYCGPVILAVLMILFGLVNHNHRNAIGPGVAILILHMGLIYTFKGRISLSDFLRK